MAALECLELGETYILNVLVTMLCENHAGDPLEIIRESQGYTARIGSFDFLYLSHAQQAVSQVSLLLFFFFFFQFRFRSHYFLTPNMTAKTASCDDQDPNPGPSALRPSHFSLVLF